MFNVVHMSVKGYHSQEDLQYTTPHILTNETLAGPCNDGSPQVLFLDVWQVAKTRCAIVDPAQYPFWTLDLQPAASC
jgi:hypothetical protein